MKFLLYTKVNERNVKHSLGMPEYSYYFVYKEFKDVFSEFGEIVTVHSKEEIATNYELSTANGVDCVVVFFCPPHVAPDVYPLKAFCVLAWEFDTIPNESWDGDKRNDWRYVLDRHIGLICLSSHTREVVRKEMGADYHVSDIAVPVWDSYAAELPENSVLATERSLKLDVEGNVIDSHAYAITEEKFEIDCGTLNFKLEPWSGKPLQFVFDHEHTDSAFLGGFYHAEGWGTWSRMETPWLFLQAKISGDIEVSFRARGFGASVGKEISLNIGGVVEGFTLSAESTEYHLDFNDVPPSNIIRFVGLDLTPPGYDFDARSMAIGLESLVILDRSGDRRVTDQPCNHTVSLDVSGLIYTTVFNPADARKNWEDIVRAFCYVFSENEKATLILKVTHQHLSSMMGRLHFLLQQIGNVRCRVIAVHGFLQDNSFRKLIENTSYYVNASSAEGLCLPLLEFMASGVPAIAPEHTAMADYIDEKSSFVVASSKEPSIWPHDPRLLKRATSYRVNWESLVEQFENSYSCATTDRSRYERKCLASQENVKKYTASSLIKAKLEIFLKQVKLL
ncbi:hypothetical protein SIN8267_02393 [Sinobacterium norvegicum]|uniref:DUF7024 domain-containing protein n=1 Tax=Sinobacterium norvegicum TaxID=1641715 RepID=A0ABM9AGE6_9GAMM|nr:glycosyltransferase family 4 protein [Sinobacterium norvegicum]CAH0992274.1 hypothetical protein SIN8267_02393 [Sinobacterium norvegicum]